VHKSEGRQPQPYKHPEYPEEETIPFFPNYIILEVITSYILLAVLIVLASLLPTGLEERADPFSTPQHIKPEWYFLWIFQFVKVPPRIIGPGLLAELDGLLDQLSARDIGEVAWRQAGHDFEAFASHLLAHERRENAVVQEGYNEDLGLVD